MHLAQVVALAWLMVAVLGVATTPAHAETEAAIAQRRIKAAYLSKFAEYVEWPAAAFATPDTPFVVAVADDDAMADELQGILADRRLDGRGFAVRRLHDNDATQGVHVLFVPAARRALLTAGWVRRGQPVLLVSDFEGALAQGATINLVVRDAHVRFEVSLADAERRRLKLGSRLLSVAQNVRRSSE